MFYIQDLSHAGYNNLLPMQEEVSVILEHTSIVLYLLSDCTQYQHLYDI